ncbi:hypothetical protein HWV62_751 [Athelia sp. TMB]|nr:hypothetical protein HWV62_751 [Athelia sp. TMB]
MASYDSPDVEDDTSSEVQVPQVQAGPANVSQVQMIVALAQQMVQQVMGKQGTTDGALSSAMKLVKPSRTKTDVEKKAIEIMKHKNRGIESPSLASPSTKDPYPYVRNVEKGASARPEVGDVFDRLLSAQGKERRAHSNGMSGLAHASLTIIALSLSRSNVLDNRYNETSPYLDLSPLYGVNEEETNSVRIKDGRGMLAPDCFSESRTILLHPATAALLILWNRNHNYYAEHLLSNNEGEKWRDLTSSPVAGSLPLDLQDDQIFKQARKINCAIFRKFVAEDLVKGLTGHTNVDGSSGLEFLRGSQGVHKGYQSSVESSLLYHWSGLSSKVTEDWIKHEMINISGDRAATITIEEYQEDIERVAIETSTNKQWRNLGLRRGVDGRVDDADIARVLQDATESVACSTGARSIPPSLRVIEMMAMKKARDWKVCSLNDFRNFLGLKAYSSFDEWSSSSEVASAARTMYGDIANLELYTYGLLVDLITRVRSDPEIASMKEFELTKWGYSQCTAKRDDNGASGAVLPTLLIRHLSSNYPYDNVYSLFPFIIPTKAKEIIGNLSIAEQDLYDQRKPHIGAAVSLEASSDIHAVFEDSTGAYSTPYGRDLKSLTKGTGFLLGFEEKHSHDTDKLMILYALLPDRTILSKYAKSFRRLTDHFIGKQSTRSGNQKEVDIINSVINRTCARWVCDTIYGNIDKKPQCGPPLPKTDEKWVFESLVDLHNFIFQNYRKEDGWRVRSKALEASEKLSKQIEERFKASSEPNEETIWGVAVRVYREMNEGLHVGGVSSDGFLERLDWWMESHQKDATSGNLDRPTGHDVNTPKIVANVLGLCIMTCASFAQVCSQAVDFYLQDERAKERKLIVELAEQNNPRDNAQIMGYIREAQRMEQPLVLTRVANKDTQISQKLFVKEGDCIVADFKHIHMNAAEVPSPKTIDFKRQTPSIQGLGSHKCLGVPFVDEASTSINRQYLHTHVTSLPDSRLCLRPKPTRVVLPKMKDYLVKATIALAALIALIIILYLAASIRLPEWPSSQQQTKCNGPFTTDTKPYHKYQAFSFVPGRGTDKPLPYKYTTKDKKPHRMTIMDADQRDMQFTIWIDGIIAGVTSDFVLDKSVDCGEVAKTCWQKQFSMGIVDVPSGKHTVEIRWAGKGT